MKRGYLFLTFATVAALAGGVALARGRAQRQYALDRALNDAVYAGDAGRVRALLARGADPNVRRNPGDQAEDAVEWIALVLHPERGKPTGATALMCAATCGRTEIVRQLLAAGADPTVKDADDPLACTALRRAIDERHDEVVALLLDGGAPANEPGDSISTPLIQAVLDGCRGKAVEALLRHGARLDPGSPVCQDIVFRVARDLDASALTACLDRGVSVDVTGGAGLTLLMEAASGGNLSTTRVLIARGAHVNARDWYGSSALHWAEDNRTSVRRHGATGSELASYSAVIALLKAHGAKK